MFANTLIAPSGACPTVCVCKTGECTTAGAVLTSATLQTFSNTKLKVSGSLGPMGTTFVNVTSSSSPVSPVILATGTASLSGTLRFQFGPQYVPTTHGSSTGSIIFLQASTVVGTYTSVVGSNSHNVIVDSITATYTSTTVTLNYAIRAVATKLGFGLSSLLIILALIF